MHGCVCGGVTGLFLPGGVAHKEGCNQSFKNTEAVCPSTVTPQHPEKDGIFLIIWTTHIIFLIIFSNFSILDSVNAASEASPHCLVEGDSNTDYI